MTVELDDRERKALEGLEHHSGRLLMLTSRDRLKNPKDPLASEVKRINAEITRFVKFYRHERQKIRVYPKAKNPDGDDEGVRSSD